MQKTVTVGGMVTTTDFIYHGELLMGMMVGNDRLHFFYDALSRPAMARMNGEIYTYVYNLQGDTVGILDSEGQLVVEYKYDTWGRLLSITGNKAATLGKLNPFRYRGYVYDEETGLYYLRSRYYNPEWGGFISADDSAYLGADGTVLSCNLFSYCNNNLVMGFDPSGHWDWGLFRNVLVTTAIVVGCLTGVGVAAAVATSVTTAVTVSVTTASVSTAFASVDGAICAQQSGGKWYDGAMAGAIGGSMGAMVSTIRNQTLGSDAALRMNTAGRAVGSLAYDISYDLFSTGEITPDNVAVYALDVTMDTALAPINDYYTGNITNDYLRTSINGVVDGAVDVFQTVAYFNPMISGERRSNVKICRN